MGDARFQHRVEAVRRFNRFYTRQIGVLNEGFLQSPFSLTDVRVLYEIAQREKPTASALAGELGLDPGYLSRILRDFSKRRLIQKKPSGVDGRQSLLSLTKQGQRAFANLNVRSHEDIAALLNKLSESQQDRLLQAMTTIEQALGASAEDKAPYLLRLHQPGDMGWVISRHGVLYAQEYGWDERFEALVADIVAKFIRNFDPKRECCWIAEKNGENVGSVFLVEKSKNVAQLRLLLVEPSVRGLGIGSRLVDECVRFSRHKGYRKLMLWTNSVLDAARHIYEKAGFRLVHEESHHSFGRDLVGQTWELKL